MIISTMEGNDSGSLNSPYDTADRYPNTPIAVSGSGVGVGSLSFTWRVSGNANGSQLTGTFDGSQWTFSGDFAGADGSGGMNLPSQPVSGAISAPAA
jgi:hypothetical protein